MLPRGCLLNACYSIEKVLGRGGFGITYLAKDTKLNLPVAVKEYLPAPFAGRSEDFEVEPYESKQYEFEWGLSRFISEAQILAQWGEQKKALEVLQRAKELGDSGLTYALMDPTLNPLRDTDEFKRLLAELGYA